jgi:hypothetical protein
MAPQKNILKEKPAPAKEHKPRFTWLKKRFGFTFSKKAKAVMDVPKDIISGDIIQKKESSKLFSLLPWLTLLAFLYITNNYHAEEQVREINRRQKDIKELRYRYISTKSKLMNMSKQSVIEKKLAKKGFEENSEPLKVIKVSRRELKSLKNE